LVTADNGFSAPGAPPCIPDSGDRAFTVSPLEFLDFRWDTAAKTFFYPGDTYPLLRSLRDGTIAAVLELFRPRSASEAVFTAALLARFPFGTGQLKSSLLAMDDTDFTVPLHPLEQRILLIRVLTGKLSGRALNYLLSSGFISRYWPELAALETASHSKDFHPEGDGWKHTLEALAHRKTTDLTLSLGILLHDIGKPRAASRGNKRYDGHAELGAGIARRFLERLEFSPRVIENTVFLVKNHMLPAAFPSLPLYRIRNTLESPLVPQLLELYRCDEASSFRRLQGYYASCETYKSFLKRAASPGPAGPGR
jgi:poly(A) polymerase